MNVKSAIVIAVIASLSTWHGATVAKVAPTRPVNLTEQQLKVVQSKISLPIEGLKYRSIYARETDDLRLLIDIATEYYDDHSNYRRFFAIGCGWGKRELPESLVCDKPSYIIELINEQYGRHINLGHVTDGSPASVEEVFEMVTFIRASRGKNSVPRNADVTELHSATHGYKVRYVGGGCGGWIDVIRKREGSLSIDKVSPFGMCP